MPRNRGEMASLLAVVAILSLGCGPLGMFSWMTHDPVPHMKLHDMGDALTITAWTLAQGNEDDVSNGTFALMDTIRDSSDTYSLEEKQSAMRGLERITDKVATGWPKDARPDFAERCINWTYRSMARAGQDDSRILPMFMEIGDRTTLTALQRETWLDAARQSRLIEQEGDDQ